PAAKLPGGRLQPDGNFDVLGVVAAIVERDGGRLAPPRGHVVTDRRFPAAIPGPGERTGRAIEQPPPKTADIERQRLPHRLFLLEPIPVPATHATHACPRDCDPTRP